MAVKGEVKHLMGKIKAADSNAIAEEKTNKVTLSNPAKEADNGNKDKSPKITKLPDGTIKKDY